MRLSILVLTISTWLLTVPLSAEPISQKAFPQAQAGLIDLRQWDFEKEGIIPLDGAWEFYPHTLLRHPTGAILPLFRMVPDNWLEAVASKTKGMGSATYMLTILLPKNCPKLGLQWRTMSTAFELDVNGKTVGRAGVPGLDAESDVPAYAPGYALIEPKSNVLGIILRVSNWDYRSGGPWNSITLGEYQKIAVEAQNSISFTWSVIGILLALSANSIIIFLYRPKEKANIFFSIFALLMVVRTLVTGEYLITRVMPEIPFHWVIRLEYLSADLLLIMATRFYLTFFPNKLPLWVRRGSLIVFISYGCMALVAPLWLVTNTILVLYIFTIIMMIVILISVLIPSLLARVQGAAPIFLGTLCLGLGVINDMLFNSFLIHSMNLLPYALVIFLFLQMTALAGRFGLSISHTERLTHELSETNRRLRDEVIDNVRKQDVLEELLEEKDLLIREVHHRVKNSLGIVTSILSLQAKRGSTPDESSTMRMLQLRIQALSLVHEKLYTSVSTGSILLSDYLQSLVSQLAKGFGLEQGQLVLEVPEAPIEISVDESVDMGLVMTELVSNSCKYGLSENRTGTVKVKLELIDNGVALSVVDEGPGFAADFDPATVRSLGFLMITTLLKRQGGTITLAAGAPGSVRVIFPLENLSSTPLL